jgi:hypothetical protein
METPIKASDLDAEAGERGGIILRKTARKTPPIHGRFAKKHPRPSNAPCSGRSRRAQNRRPSPDSITVAWSPPSAAHGVSVGRRPPL